MSIENIWNLENPSFEKSKNLLDIDITKVEQDFIKLKEIREKELADNEDNKVTINIEKLIEETYSNNWVNTKKKL